MAGDEEKDPNSVDKSVGSESGTGDSGSVAPGSGDSTETKPKVADSDASSSDTGSTDGGEAPKSGGEGDPDPPAGDRQAETPDADGKGGVESTDDAGVDSEQLALPGLPGLPEKAAAEEVDPHHDDYDQYHDEYHEEDYHHDEHHGDAHHEDYYEGYHDDHDDGQHDDPQHDAYEGNAVAAASRLPLDQRSVPDYEPELDEFGNEYGGPVKPFLDHLEDLRWTILKCVFAMLISMMGCMMGAKYLVGALMWPLKQAQELGFTVNHDIPIKLGHRTVGKLEFDSFEQLGMDTNAPVFTESKGRFDLHPVQVGTNMLLALRPRVPEATTGFVTDFDEVMVELKNYGPFESIWLCLQLALYGGLVIGAPFIIFFVAEFVLPALKVNEKKFLYQAAGVGAILFFLGVAFCYFLIVQVALKASVEFSLWLGFAADEWKASEYLSFVVKLLLVMGVAFELPVVLLTIVKIGLLDYKKLSEFRSYFIVGMLVAAAVITPSGDPFTMTLVAIPLWFLYEICVVIARVWYKRDRAREAAEAKAEAAESGKSDSDPQA